MFEALKTNTKSTKGIGKIIFTMGGLLYPLTQIIYMLVNSNEYMWEKLNKTLMFTYLLVILLSYVLIPFMIRERYWDIVWSTIFAIVGLIYLIVHSIKFDNSKVVDYFNIIFILHLVVGSLIWMYNSLFEKQITR